MARMPPGARHRNDTLQEWQLQEIILQKRTEISRLELENQQVLRQQKVLVAFIDTIYMLNRHQSEQEFSHSLDEPVSGLLSLIEHEQQGKARPGLECTQRLSEEAKPELVAEDALLAPAEDPMFLLRQMLTMKPQHPAADCITMPKLCTMLAASVLQASVALHQHEAGMITVSPPPLDRIQQIVSDFVHLMVCLCISELNSHLISRLSLCNLETGKEVGQPDQLVHKQAVLKAGLTMPQLQQIAAGLAVTRRLLAPILLELRQLQLDDCASSCSAYSSDSINSGDSSSSSTSPTGGVGPDVTSCQALASGAHVNDLGLLPPFQRSKQLEAQRVRAERLKVVLRKERLVKTCYCCHTLGSLTWVQVAKINGLVYPRSLSFNALGQAVSEVLIENQQLKSKQLLQQAQRQQP